MILLHVVIHVDMLKNALLSVNTVTQPAQTLDDAPLTCFAEASTGLCWLRLTSGGNHNP